MENPQNVAVVHYIGDESISSKAPRGNAKHEKPFFRTQPSALRELQAQPDVEKAHKIYKEMVCENKDGHEAVTKPKNLKQVHNVRAAQKEDYIVTYPDLAIIAGSEGILSELNSIIKKVSEYDQEIPQSQTEDSPMAPRGRATQPLQDTRKTN